MAHKQWEKQPVETVSKEAQTLDLLDKGLNHLL